MVNFDRQSVLARLMAKENISVRHGNYRTAFFDVENRILGLPLWKDHGKDVYDLLVGHEVGHALYTPAEGWHDSDKEIPGVPRAYVNVIEDIRIERKVQEAYPGLVAAFKRGYNQFNKSDFFGIKDVDVNTLSLMDRINLKAKLRDLIEVEFSEAEQPYVDMAFAVQTWEDVLNACRELYNFVKENKENEQPNETQFGQAESDNGESVSDDLGSDLSSSDSGSTDEDSSDGDEVAAAENESASDNSDDAEDLKSQIEKILGESSNKEEPEHTIEVVTKNPTDYDDDEVMTDSNFRGNEESLLETGENDRYPPVAAYALTRKQVMSQIATIDDVFESRNARLEYYSDWPGKSEMVKEKTVEYNSELIEFNKDVKKFVNVMAKEFEMRKAAFQYSRASTARSGSLDVNKLHNYKFSDDIFLRVTQLPNAKSHGMVMFIDYSGSMSDVVGDVIKQTLILASFCKKVNIPFDVYSFTTGRADYMGDYKTSSGQIEAHSTMMLHLLSSSFDKATYERAFKDLFFNAMNLTCSYYDRLFGSELEHMSGTPLNEVIMAADILLDDFKSKHGVQNVNAVFLTDGYGHGLRVNTAGYDGDYSMRDIKLHLRHGVVTSKGDRQLTKVLLNYLRKRYTVIGYFLSARTYDFRGAVWDASDEHVFDPQMNAYRKEYNKNKFITFDNACGYDRFFIIKAERNSLSVDEEEFTVSEHAKKGEITRAFKKHAASKKTNRVFATQFAEMVA